VRSVFGLHPRKRGQSLWWRPKCSVGPKKEDAILVFGTTDRVHIGHRQTTRISTTKCQSYGNSCADRCLVRRGTVDVTSLEGEPHGAGYRLSVGKSAARAT
jgi:hypothetical protein